MCTVQWQGISQRACQGPCTGRHLVAHHPAPYSSRPRIIQTLRQPVYKHGSNAAAAVSTVSASNSSRPEQHAPPSLVAIAQRALQVLQALLKLWRLQQQQQQQQQSATLLIQQTVSDLGPLWVKLGQTLAVRPDVVGKQLAAALSGLQESAPPFLTAEAAAILQEELGTDPDQLFAWWSPHPVASASLGQVYKAVLRSDARLVAVKVQRPGMWAQISLDLSILTQLLRLLRWAGRIKQDITLWATTLGQGLEQELDYVQEGRNLEEFAAAHSYLGFVDTPTVNWQLTTTRVLTTSWVNGQTPGQILRSLRNSSSSSSSSNVASTQQYEQQQEQQPAGGQEQQYQQQPHQQHLQQQQQRQQLLRLVDLGIQASLHQLVVTGVLHADPHPGNLLLSGNKLVYLDFGLLVHVPPQASMAMMSALLHWSQANWLALAADMRQMGLLKPTTELQELAADLQTRFEQLQLQPTIESSQKDDQQQQHKAPATMPDTTTNSSSSSSSSGRPSALLQNAAAIGFAEFAGVIAALALKYRFELPPYYTLVIRSLTTLEGFSLMVDPTARYSIARTAVKVIAKQLLFDKRPAARQLLQEVLLLNNATGQTWDAQRGSAQLNLQLLEELLTLATPADISSSATSSSPRLATEAATAAAAVGGFSRPSEGVTDFIGSKPQPGQAVRSTQQACPNHQSVGQHVGQSFDRSVGQSLDLLEFVQDGLSLPASDFAAQLSGPEAAGVRVLLAQQLVNRWLQGGVNSSSSSSSSGWQAMWQQWQWQRQDTRGRSSTGGQPSEETESVSGATDGGAGASRSCRHEPAGTAQRPGTKHPRGASTSNPAKGGAAGPKHRLLPLLVQAGFSGVRFAWQLLCLTAALLIGKALLLVQQHLRRLLSTLV